MKIRITETVIKYREEDLTAWKNIEEKMKLLEGYSPPQDVFNQPTYHFGEYFVLNYFKKAQWSGYRFYALGEWEPNNPKVLEGREKIKEMFTIQKLEEFRRQRVLSGHAAGQGEPDLFLYMESGPTLFLEVKKGGDRVSPAQLTCLAQIKAILEADVGIVYLAKYGQKYKPKTYELNLETFEGCLHVSPEEKSNISNVSV
ncbi:hypothetical protein NNRS527_03054 [Nitrosospira sp. NRS527]|nr:hypothetical protein NNRS527_03054 [Nitrosospira sp. NRS527]